MPLHLSHYDIIRSILSNSHVEKEIYIHDDADLISTSWAIKEFNRCYTSQKENKRLIQAGIPKVTKSKCLKTDYRGGPIMTANFLLIGSKYECKLFYKRVKI